MGHPPWARRAPFPDWLAAWPTPLDIHGVPRVRRRFYALSRVQECWADIGPAMRAPTWGKVDAQRCLRTVLSQSAHSRTLVLWGSNVRSLLAASPLPIAPTELSAPYQVPEPETLCSGWDCWSPARCWGIEDFANLAAHRSHALRVGPGGNRSSIPASPSPARPAWLPSRPCRQRPTARGCRHEWVSGAIVEKFNTETSARTWWRSSKRREAAATARRWIK